MLTLAFNLSNYPSAKVHRTYWLLWVYLSWVSLFWQMKEKFKGLWRVMLSVLNQFLNSNGLVEVEQAFLPYRSETT
jgi:hypothetical protein